VRRRAVPILVILLAAVSPGIAHAAFPGENGRIAFARHTSGSSSDIFTVNPDGSGLLNLTRNSAVDDRYPAWSGDGTRLTFRSEPHVWTMAADGSDQVLLRRGGDPSISPDGTQVAYGATARWYPESNEEVFVANADGNDVRNLINDPLGPEWPDDREPVWSPDGRRIAFVRDDSFYVNEEYVHGIWIANAEGTEFTPVIGPAAQPDWSPDGKRFVFSAYGDIWVSDADGYNVRFLTGSLEGDSYPVWSPDGKQIAFQRYRGSGAAYDVWVVDADGSNERLAIADATEPDWQPKVPGEPVCSYVSVWPSVLQPADRTLRKVWLSVPADPSGNPVAVEITGVTQDELVGLVPDALRVPRRDRVRLRAEHSRAGDGRVYEIAFKAADGQGGECTGTASVEVRRDQYPATNSAPPSYNSFTPRTTP
jgi:WD40 repeat protein